MYFSLDDGLCGVVIYTVDLGVVLLGYDKIYDI